MMGFGLAAFICGNDFEAIKVTTTPTYGGLVVGTTIGALPSLLSGGRTGAMLILATFFSGAVTMLALIGYREALSDTAPVVCIVVLLSVLVRWAIGQSARNQKPWIAHSLGVAVLVVLVWLSLDVYLGEESLGIVAALSVVLALISSWTCQPGSNRTMPWGIVVLIWFSLATYSFSVAYGLGIAVCALCGVGTLLLLDRIDLLPAVGVLATFGFYRVFRETYPSIVEPFDIGQHYGIMGFIFGVLVMFALLDGLKAGRRADSFLGGVSKACIALAGLVVVLFIAAFFGAKGAIGLVLGLGIAPALLMLTELRNPLSFVGAAGLQCAVLVAYTPLAVELTLTKEAKTNLFLIVAVFCALVAAFVFFVGRKQSKESREVRSSA